MKLPQKKKINSNDKRHSRKEFIHNFTIKGIDHSKTEISPIYYLMEAVVTFSNPSKLSVLSFTENSTKWMSIVANVRKTTEENHNTFSMLLAWCHPSVQKMQQYSFNPNGDIKTTFLANISTVAS